MSVVVVSSSSFPESGANRVRRDVISELCDWVGGHNSNEQQVRAGRSWDQAVRRFNSIAWRFNRMQQSITLSSTSGASTYSLSSDFRSPLRAMLLDSSGRSAAGPVIYVPFVEWTGRSPDQTGTGSEPEYYTVRNEHETGIVTVDPPTGGSNTYPTLQMNYHRWIQTQSGDASPLDVPRDVDEAIFELALAIFLSKTRSFQEARDQFMLAAHARSDAERKWRDYDEDGN